MSHSTSSTVSEHCLALGTAIEPPVSGRRRLVRWGAGVLATGMAVCVLASPAEAAASPVMTLCEVNSGRWLVGTQSHTLNGDNRDGIKIGGIQSGDVVRVTASGSVSYGGWFGSAGTWGPAGNGELAPAPGAAWPAPGQRKFAVVGIWAHLLYLPQRSQMSLMTHPVFFDVATDSGCQPAWWGGTSAPQPALEIRTNDDLHEDNRGSYRVTVQVWRPR